jgi:hypothetical protein
MGQLLMQIIDEYYISSFKLQVLLNERHNNTTRLRQALLNKPLRVYKFINLNTEQDSKPVENPIFKKNRGVLCVGSTSSSESHARLEASKTE